VLAGFRADAGGRLGLDQLLQDPLGQGADEFKTVRRS